MGRACAPKAAQLRCVAGWWPFAPLLHSYTLTHIYRKANKIDTFTRECANTNTVSQIIKTKKKIWSQNLTQTKNRKFQNLEHRLARLALWRTTPVETRSGASQAGDRFFDMRGKQAKTERFLIFKITLTWYNKREKKTYIFQKHQCKNHTKRKSFGESLFKQSG